MSENIIKATSFRVGQEEIEKFKELTSSENMNQAEAFELLISTYEMAKAKSVLTNRAKEIEAFEEALNSLLRIYTGSLEVNNMAEKNIREQLSLELTTKDTTIKELQEFKLAATLELKESKAKLTETLKGNEEIQVKVKGLEKEIDTKNENIKMLNNQVSFLTEELTNNKEEVAKAKELRTVINNLNKDLEEVKTNLLNKEMENKNLTKQLDFYTNNISELKKEHKENIEEIKAENKLVVKELKEEFEMKYSEIKTEHNKEVVELNASITKIKDVKDTLAKEVVEVKTKYSTEVDILKTSISKEISEKDLALKELEEAKSKIEKLENAYKTSLEKIKRLEENKKPKAIEKKVIK